MSLIRRYAEFGHKDENVAVYWNSTVAIVSNVLQNFLLSVFFVILARSYGPTLFAQYVVANSLYQLIAVIAPFGLLSYFVREYSQRPDDRHDLLKDFFQIEFLLSLFGFATVVAIVLGLRYETEIVILAAILGINLFFDNFIYYIKSINVAESTLVTTRYLNGLVPETCIASICSVTFIDASSAPIPDPTFPAKINAVITGPISRIIETATIAGSQDSAPNFANVGLD